MTDMASLRAKVSGRVQGVFFRAFVKSHALELHLSGYVRNLPDGTVEAVAEGERQRLEKLVEYLGKGPPPARVAKVQTEWSDYRGIFKDFRVMY
jgi:acylphosphatase